MPVLVGFLLYRFSKSSKRSRVRIKAIEGSDSHRQRLIHIFTDLENRMETAIVSVAHDVAEIGVNSQTSATEESNWLKTNGNADGADSATPLVTLQTGPNSLLSEEQKKMVRSLNTIPNMKKYRVFFTEVRNSHAIIISRDPRRFKIHDKGVEVLKHWADRFDL